jgi:hypothetical protein
MSKTAILSLFILMAGFAPLVARADFSSTDWNYKKAILNVKPGLVEVSLDNEVFANAAKNLADLRIVGNSNSEVPYKLITAKSETNKKSYQPKLVNNSVVPGKYSTVILDLGQRGIISNSIAITTSSENFQRNVTVFGSDDQNDWNILNSDGYIYDYTDKRGNMKSQNTSIAFSDSAFQYLKVEISDSDNSPILISSATVNQYTLTNSRQFSTPVQFESSQDRSVNSTIIIADLGQGGIPTDKIVLFSDGKNFNRGVSVYSGNDKNSSDWKYVGQGYIFRYDTPKFAGENLDLDIDETTDRYLKIVIYNNDDAPLNFSKVASFATYRNLIFQAKDGQTYDLYYGNRKAYLPKYDLEKYLQYFDLTGTQKISLGAQINNATFVPEQEPEKPLTERMPYLLTFILCTMGLILLLLVYKFLKKTD